MGDIVTGGRSGKPTVGGIPELVDSKGKRQSTAEYNLKKNTAGPKGKLPGSKREDSHTVYHQMGMLMAEALGLVSEGKFDYMQDTPAGEAKTREAQKERARKETEDNRKAIAAAVQRRGGSSSSTTTTTPRPASEADPDTPGQRAVAKRYGRSSTA